MLALKRWDNPMAPRRHPFLSPALGAVARGGDGSAEQVARVGGGVERQRLGGLLALVLQDTHDRRQHTTDGWDGSSGLPARWLDGKRMRWPPLVDWSMELTAPM